MNNRLFLTLLSFAIALSIGNTLANYTDLSILNKDSQEENLSAMHK